MCVLGVDGKPELDGQEAKILARETLWQSADGVSLGTREHWWYVAIGTKHLLTLKVENLRKVLPTSLGRTTVLISGLRTSRNASFEHRCQPPAPPLNLFVLAMWYDFFFARMSQKSSIELSKSHNDSMGDGFFLLSAS